MNKWLFGPLGLGWFGAVFLGSWWYTFPSEETGAFLASQISTATNGAYVAEFKDLSPWWAGASADSVKLYSTGAEPTLVAMAQDAGLRVNLFSALRMQPTITATANLQGGQVDVVLSTARNEKTGRPNVTALKGTISALPLLAMPMVAMEGTGTVDANLDLNAPDGLKKADGVVQLSGRNLVITSLEIPGQGDVVKMLQSLAQISEILIEELDLQFDVVQGKATVRRGRLLTNLGTVTLSGDLTLKEDIMRSPLKLQASLVLDEKLKMVSGMLGPASADGSHTYEITGMLGHPSFGAPRAARSRALSAATGPRIQALLPTQGAGGDPDTVITGGEGGSAEDLAERAEDIRERLRKRREERLGRRGEASRPVVVGGPDDGYDPDLEPPFEDPPPEGDELLPFEEDADLFEE